MSAYYQKTAQEVVSEFSTSLEKGLSSFQAKDRLATFGPNEIAQKRTETIFEIFLRQFKSPLIYILIFAAALVLVLGGTIDALVILAVITFNSVIGTLQEGKARNSLARLKSLTKHRAVVRRGGEELLVSAESLVSGDILLLHEGDRVVADARIVKCDGLKVNEAILTGESEAVVKMADVISRKNLVVGDQKNMVFAGTSVVSGSAECVVVEVGINSQIGKISKGLLETADVPLPLAKKIVKLTHFIAIGTFVIAVLTFLVGILRGIEFAEILGAVIGLAVSVVPEGLPVAVTIILAGGVWRMAKAHAIIRQMAAVEAMGNADTLLVDKTGTITTGNMNITKISFGDELFSVSGTGYSPKGQIVDLDRSKNREKILKMLALTRLSLNAEIIFETGQGWQARGDSTEAAIAALAERAGLSREKLEKIYKTDFARPFDPKKRYIEGAFSKDGEKWHIFVGAPEFLSKNLKINHGLLTDYHQLASEGLRVIGVCLYGPREKKFFGWMLLAIEEEIRPQVRNAVFEAKKAGFKVVMLTGDFPQTAQAIARKVGIFQEGDTVISGEEVEKLAKVELEEKIGKVSVFARITPEHKLSIVNAFKDTGHVCAMTGDGVNDAPALQAAHLGIGLGSGTQVAKDASDIVLVNDNFATIVKAIAEGRSIYLSLKKVILYLFSTSLGEVAVILGAVILGLPLPLVAVQIIWLNFVTDGFFVVALSQDQPRHKLVSKEDVASDSLLDGLMIKRMVVMSFAMFVATMPLFLYFLDRYSISYARTMALIVLSVTQWFNAFNVRSRTLSVFKRKLDNKFLVAAFFAVLVLQFIVVETSFGNRIMHTENIALSHWILAFCASTLIIWVEEARKMLVKFKVHFSQENSLKASNGKFKIANQNTKPDMVSLKYK